MQVKLTIKFKSSWLNCISSWVSNASQVKVQIQNLVHDLSTWFKTFHSSQLDFKLDCSKYFQLDIIGKTKCPDPKRKRTSQLFCNLCIWIWKEYHSNSKVAGGCWIERWFQLLRYFSSLNSKTLLPINKLTHFPAR